MTHFGKEKQKLSCYEDTKVERPVWQGTEITDHSQQESEACIDDHINNLGN